MQRAGLAFGLSCLALISTAGPAAADPPTNSSFEAPDIPTGTFTIFPTGSTGIPGWVVVAGTVEVGDSTFNAAHGSQSVDLEGANGGGNGVLQQTFTTAVNTGYVISWQYGANGSCDPDEVQTGTFSVQGAAVETMAAFPTSGSDPNWQTLSTTFAGTGGPVTLQFADTGDDDGCGLTLDNVAIAVDPTVTPIVDPKAAGVIGAVALGGGLYLVHRRRTQHELGRVIAG